MYHDPETWHGPELRLFAAAVEAGQQVPPLWPLTASVAVNPYLGQAGEPLPVAAARLARVAGAPVTPDRAERLAKIDSGEIAEEDLRAALGEVEGAPEDLAAVMAVLREPAPAPHGLPTIAELVAEATGVDWAGLIADRIGHWAAAHFDRGQALWPAPDRGAFASWHAFAARDLTPEMHGLRGFAAHVAELSPSARPAIAQAGRALGLTGEGAASYFHALHLSLNGWSQLARQMSFEAELAGGQDRTLKDLLAIRLVWEEALLEQHRDAIGTRWEEVREAHAAPLAPTEAQVGDAVLQRAAERAAARHLSDTLAAPGVDATEGRPDVQAAFCIDVRSEVFRRALEGVASGVITLGFAGFFGLPLRHRGHASDVAEAHAPVLLLPSMESRTEGADDAAARIARRATRAWDRFRMAAVSSFAFVEAAGPLYVGKLLRDGLGRAVVPGAEPVPVLDGEIEIGARVDAAEGILRAMSLTDGFAPLVLIAGHGAEVVNNPHAAALQCGACGGFSGDVNARILATLLNEGEVRAGLAERGIAVPDDTLFIAGLHDTTTDVVTLYSDVPSPDHDGAVGELRGWLSAAGLRARTERARRLPRASAPTIAMRARDWSEVRPEWALANCQAFIAAPRARTRGRDLGGRVFLHDYEWERDEGFAVLEGILTAPVVVASWISLQYYGSTVAPDLFGGGDKLLHNAVGGFGVLEGNGGLLRGGLPLQSVFDGDRPVHDPLRLLVAIEAPDKAVDDILVRHPGVAALFGNGWLGRAAIEPDGSLRLVG